MGIAHELVDLRDWDLPICDGKECYNHPSIAPVTEKVSTAKALLIVSPVYNYDLNAAIKNFVELTGRAWSDKPVGMLCMAGGHNSYMSPMSLANSLMFDFRCHIVPRYVYATADDFTEDRLLGNELSNRIRELVTATADLADALQWLKTRA
jgi:FMN reductase